MPRRRAKAPSCYAKARFGDEHTANLAAARYIDKYLRAYPCRHCSGWHLTSKKEKQ